MSNTVRIRKKSDYEKAMEMVNHPPHYTQGGIEQIEVMRATLTREKFIGAMEYNEKRYMRRWDSKGITDDMSEDEKNLVKFVNLSKAEFHLKELLSMHKPKGIGTPEYEDVDVGKNK